MLEQYIKELSQALKKVGVVIIMIVFVAVFAKTLIDGLAEQNNNNNYLLNNRVGICDLFFD